jgi:hypothetical protein
VGDHAAKGGELRKGERGRSHTDHRSGAEGGRERHMDLPDNADEGHCTRRHLHGAANVRTSRGYHRSHAAGYAGGSRRDEGCNLVEGHDDRSSRHRVLVGTLHADRPANVNGTYHDHGHWVRPALHKARAA